MKGITANAKTPKALKKTGFNETQRRTNESGLTLLVLGITIVVLLIIAGITMAVLTKDNGIINEATNAAIQTETAKVHEEWGLYIKNKEFQRVKSRSLKKPSIQEQLEGTVKNVISTEDLNGEEKYMNLGVISDFKTLEIESEYGKGYENVEEGDLDGSMMDNLDDVFVIDFATNSTYYIKNKRIWTVEGETDIAKVVQGAVDEGGGNLPEADKTKVKVSFAYYSQEKRGQKSETKTIEIEEGGQGTVTPPTVTDTTINGKTAKPRGWSKSKEPDAEIEVQNGNTIEVTAENNGDKYYMSYNYKDVIKYMEPDGDGSSTEKQIEQNVDVGSDGKEKREDVTIPDAKIPEDLERDGWEKEKGTGKDPETGNGITEGNDVWTTDPSKPDDKDKWVDPKDPSGGTGGSSGGSQDTPIYPVYKKNVTITYEAPEATPESIPESQTGTMYRSIEDNTVQPAEITITETTPTKDGFKFTEWQNKTQTETKYQPNQQVQFTDSATLEATWEEEGISAKDAGSIVEYTDLNGDGDMNNDWLLFYVSTEEDGDKGAKYLIAKDFLEYSRLETIMGAGRGALAEGMKQANGSKYGISWNGSGSCSATGNLSEAKASLNGKYFFNQFTDSNISANSGYNNKKMTATLLNTNNWARFRRAKAADSETAIGGPTLELWTKAWNAKGYKDLYTKTDDVGYYIGWEDSPSSKYINDAGSQDSTGYNDTMFFPYHDGKDMCFGYWMASPSAVNSNYLAYAGYNGSLGNSSYDYTCPYVGTRPCIYLPAEVQMEKVEDKHYKIPDEDPVKPNQELMGKDVQYTDLDGNPSTKDWQLFYVIDDEEARKDNDGQTNEGVNVGDYYLIAKDYLLYSDLTRILGDAEETPLKYGLRQSVDPEYADYCVYWYDGSNSTGTKTLNNISTQIADTFFLRQYKDRIPTDTTDGGKQVYTLIDDTLWSSFLRKDADEKEKVIGGSTLELWAKSWNVGASEDYKITTKIGDEGSGGNQGYALGLGLNPSFYWMRSRY